MRTHLGKVAVVLGATCGVGVTVYRTGHSVRGIRSGRTVLRQFGKGS